jgi:outer membrane protein assembly factor BamB
MRPFRAVRFDNQDQMYAQFQESRPKAGVNAHIDLKTGKSSDGASYDREKYRKGNVLLQIKPMSKSRSLTEDTEWDVYDPVTGAQMWSKRFPHETPVLRTTDGDDWLLVLDQLWATSIEDTAHTKSKFVKSSDTKWEWLPRGLVIVVLDSHTGEVKRQIAVPESEQPGQRYERRNAALYGDYLVVYGNDNNSVIYRVSDGMRLGAFFGRVIAGDAKLGLLAATNRDQEILLIDANNGKELKRVTVDHLPRVSKIVPARNALLVLTASQRVYSIDLPAAMRMTR